jgi:Dihydrouridine synthase (Dus)
MRPSPKLIFQMSLSDSQRKKGSIGQIRLVRGLSPEVTSDKRSPSARSRTLDYSWKSCEVLRGRSNASCSHFISQPFRRLCVSLGADITCGESECFSTRYRLLGKLNWHIVGLATSFLSGSKEEWSLVRRHPSETMFGVQVAGSKPTTLVPTAELIARESSGCIDFMDLNCGCPIDLVFRTGSGSACMALCSVCL